MRKKLGLHARRLRKPKGTPGRGRPPIHHESWSKISVVLFDRQVVHLDRVASKGLQWAGGRSDVTDQEKQKVDDLIGRLEMAVGQIFPRDAANSALITEMIQNLNGLRSVLGVVRPH